MHKSKFSIGDKVLSGRFGPPSVYLVVGMIEGESYSEGLKQYCQGTADHWSKEYPDWKESLVYYLKTNSPQKSLSYTEYLDQTVGGTYEGYQSLVNLSLYSLPEADLTSLDDI